MIIVCLNAFVQPEAYAAKALKSQDVVSAFSISQGNLG
jgi:hypothetical protein